MTAYTAARPVAPSNAPDLVAAYPYPPGGAIALLPCPYCHAGPGEACRTYGTNRPVRGTFHRDRVDAYGRACRNKVMRMVLCADEPRFGLARGDILACVAYPYDSKVTVLRRESDGFDPECNQYNHNVRLIEFTDEQRPW